MTDVLTAARDWIAGDPDPSTRSSLQRLVDSQDRVALRSLVGKPLMFGTAGIRGEVGPGPSRMNRAVVIRTTWGLARFLKEEGHKGPVIVGFDARPTSRMFAEDAAGVLAAAGFSVLYFPDPTPTPLAAFAAKFHGASGAVVVTASHNPPQDNGYKVYGPDASQIVSPTDTEIQRFIASAPQANAIARIDNVFEHAGDGVETLGPSIVDEYWKDVSKTRSRSIGSKLKIVYTPIHGVGLETFTTVMTAAGHIGVIPVSEQAKPDGTFPTVSFPNPEEPGALDLALDLGQRSDADLILANDPDADRLAAVVPTTSGWRGLTGNEIGAVLGEYLLSNYEGEEPPIVSSSIVSSPLMGLIADHHDARFERTLTGFKWIMRAALTLEEQGVGHFVFGYEEALGYSVGNTVRDKDGISAGLLFADLVADLNDRGETTLGYLEAIWSRHGLWVSAQTSIVKDGPEGMVALTSAVDYLAANAPEELAGVDVTEVTDFRVGGGQRAPWLGNQDLVELRLGDSGRVLARPSGTEPKLKIYVDLSEPVGTSTDLTLQHRQLLERASSVGDALAEKLPI